MFFRLFILISFIQLIQKQGNCQFIYDGSPDTISIAQINKISTAAREIRDSLKAQGYTAETFTIRQVQYNYWMTIDGRLDVYEWNGKDWLNLYQGTFHGYNFRSHQFVHNDKLYSFGGYGFWREHGEIIEFLPEKGEWEIIPESKELPYGIGYKVDSIYYIHSNECFLVDLGIGEINSVPCQYDIRGEIPQGRVFNFEDYILITSFLEDGSQFPLINKRTNEVYLSQRQPFKGIRDRRISNSSIYIEGNSMTIIYPDRSSIKYRVTDELEYYNLESSQSETWQIAAGGLVILFIGLAILFYRNFNSNKLKNSENQLFEPFKEYSGDLIDSEQLDKILGINGIINRETRKYKRAALVKEINNWSTTNYGKDLIERERDPSDKRFYLYRIQNL